MTCLDKEKIGEWIRRIKTSLVRYLESNLKLSGPDSFKEQVDEAALLKVFLGNLNGLKKRNNILDDFKNTIHRMLNYN